MRNERNVSKMNVATHMKRTMNIMNIMNIGAWILALGALMLSFTACADDEDPCADSVTAEALNAFPSAASGTISLFFRGMRINVGVDIATRRSTEDACEMYLSVEQDFNDHCGEVFAGDLYYSEEDAKWLGDLYEQDAGVRVEGGTRMDVSYELRADGDVDVWNKMVESSKQLCQDQVIEGKLKPVEDD